MPSVSALSRDPNMAAQSGLTADAVAPFAIAQTKNPAPRRNAVCLFFQKIVGLGSEEELFLVVAFVPAVNHFKPPSMAKEIFV